MKKFRQCIQLQCQPSVLRYEQQQPLFQKAYVEYQLCVQNGLTGLGLDLLSSSSESTLTQLQSNQTKIAGILNQCAKNPHVNLDELDEYMNCQVSCLDQAVQEVQRISSSMSIGMVIMITILVFAVISMIVFYVLYRYQKIKLLQKLTQTQEQQQNQPFQQEEQHKELAKIATQKGQQFQVNLPGNSIRIALPSPQRKSYSKTLLGGLSRLDVNKMKRIVDNLKIIHPSFEAMETDPTHSQQTQDSHSASFEQEHKTVSRPISISNDDFKQNLKSNEHVEEDHSTANIVHKAVPSIYFYHNVDPADEEKQSQSEIATAVFGVENFKTSTWNIKNNNMQKNKPIDKRGKKRGSTSLVDRSTYNVNQSINSQVPLLNTDQKEDSLADRDSNNNNNNNNSPPQVSSRQAQMKAKSLHIIISSNEMNDSLEVLNRLERRRDSISNQKSNRFSDCLDNSFSPSSVRSYLNTNNLVTASPVNSTYNDTQTQLNAPSPSQPSQRQSEQLLPKKNKLFTSSNRYSIYSPKNIYNNMDSPEIKRNSLQRKRSFDNQPSFGYQFHLQTEHASPTKYFTPKHLKTQPEEEEQQKAMVAKVRGQLLANEAARGGGGQKLTGSLMQVVSIPSISQLQLDCSLDYSSPKGQLISGEKEEEIQQDKINKNLSMIEIHLNAEENVNQKQQQQPQ